MKLLSDLWGHLRDGSVHVWNQLKNGNAFPALTAAAHTVVGAAAGAMEPAAETLMMGFVSGHPADSATVISSLAGAGVPALVGSLMGLLMGLAKHSPNLVIQRVAESVTDAEVASATQAIDNKIIGEVIKLNPTKSVPPVTGAPAKVSMVLLLVGGLFALSTGLHAQTIWKYGGGLSLSKYQMTAPVSGVFLSPLMQLSTQPLSIQNGEFYLGSNIGADFAYALSWGSISKDNNGVGVDVSPNFYITAYLGGDALQKAPDSGTYVGQGVVGIGFGVPSIVGNASLGPQTQLGGNFLKSIGIAFSITNTFDVLDGFGVIQL